MRPEALSAAADLTPNALLVISAISGLGRTGQASPKSDDAGWAVGTNAAWVRRHGRALQVHYDGTAGGHVGFADLSVNGHCSLTRDGMALASLLRTAVPDREPRAGCSGCGRPRVASVHSGRQLYACGNVAQWCPAAVPGLDAPEIPARSRKSQHDGTWHRVTGCGGLRRMSRNEIEESRTSDGRALGPGSPVTVNHGSPAKGRMGDLRGIVAAAANGTVLVDWEACEGRGEILGDVFAATELATPGVPDATGLSEYQVALLEAYRRNEVTILLEDGKVVAPGRFNRERSDAKKLEGMRAAGLAVPRALLDGRPIPRRSVEILAARGLIEEYRRSA